MHIGEGSDEYKNPREFFRRTFLTESLKRLLVGGVQRLLGQGGDPAVQLQTNFGGGKTHSMLALYHLVSGVTPGELAGVDAVLAEAAEKSLPKARRVVLVGNRISPGNPVTKPDGTLVRTLWGEIAWQLGFAAGGVQGVRKAYERIRQDDERATSGGDALRELAAAATYLYQDGPRLWYATQPTVTKLAEDRAEQLRRDPDPESYQWLLAPEQVTPQAPITWQVIRLTGGDALAVRASKRLRGEELLVSALGATILRKHLDDVPLWRGDHVALRQLVEDFACYLYLPRLAGPEVLVNAVRDGLALLTWEQDAFAYAESYDETAGRYRGLRGGQMVTLTAESAGLLVRPDMARRQMDTEVPLAVPGVIPSSETGAGAPVAASSVSHLGVTALAPGAATPPRPRRFYGIVRLDPARTGRDASRVADEVIAHLAGQVGAEVTVTLEIEALLPDGASDQIVRTVTENSRTLKFDSHGFERD